MKKYIIVALRKPSDEERANAALNRYCSRVYSVYAPRAWFVEFNGSARELTDYLWPDEELGRHGFDSGYVAPVKPNGSGYLARSFWEWLEWEGA